MKQNRITKTSGDLAHGEHFEFSSYGEDIRNSFFLARDPYDDNYFFAVTYGKPVRYRHGLVRVGQDKEEIDPSDIEVGDAFKDVSEQYVDCAPSVFHVVHLDKEFAVLVDRDTIPPDHRDAKLVNLANGNGWEYVQPEGD